jgi:hypothetical protein
MHRDYIGTVCEHARPDDLVCIFGVAFCHLYYARQILMTTDHVISLAERLTSVILCLVRLLGLVEQEKVPEQEF